MQPESAQRQTDIECSNGIHGNGYKGDGMSTPVDQRVNPDAYSEFVPNERDSYKRNICCQRCELGRSHIWKSCVARLDL